MNNLEELTDKKTLLLDKVIGAALTIMNQPEKEIFKKLEDIFESRGKELVDHLKDKWYHFGGDFGRFYISCDDIAQTLLLESFGVKVSPSKYPDTIEGKKQKFEDQMFKSRWETEPFELNMVFKFYLMCNNNSLELVESLESAEILNHFLEESGINKYGNGRNWSEYYIYLIDREIVERNQIVKYAYSTK